MTGVLLSGRQYATTRRLTPRSVLPIKVMVSPPTIGPPVNTATAITSAKLWLTQNLTSTNQSFFSTTVGSSWSRFGAAFPDYLYATQVTPSVGAGSAYGRVEFLFDGTTLEIQYKGSGAALRIWVDGEIAASAATIIPANGNLYFLPVTFATRAVRHIAIDHVGLKFYGVNTGPIDSVWQAGTPRPKALIFGDSFAEGTGATSGVDTYAAITSAHLGWDIWSAGQGGSGVSATGSYTGKYATRLPFFTNTNFDAIIIQGSVNDFGIASATVQADATAMIALTRAQWSGAAIIVTSPLMNKGAESWLPDVINTRKALQTAASLGGPNVFFVDLMEMPLNGPATATTLSSLAVATATTISLGATVAVGTTIEIGTGATVERRVVTNVSGGGPYTITVPALTFAHSAGETVTQVGPSMWTGLGRVGAATGSGNCDVLVSADTTHPSTLGHAAIGRCLADLICRTALSSTTTT